MINSHHAGVCFNFVGRHHQQMFGVKWATYIYIRDDRIFQVTGC